MEIIEKIKEIRKNKRITQKQIATYLKIAQTSYTYIENGKTRLSLEDYLKICKFLEIDPMLLIKDTNAIIITITEEEANTLNKINEKIKRRFIRIEKWR